MKILPIRLLEMANTVSCVNQTEKDDETGESFTFPSYRYHGLEKKNRITALGQDIIREWSRTKEVFTFDHALYTELTSENEEFDDMQTKFISAMDARELKSEKLNDLLALTSKPSAVGNLPFNCFAIYTKTDEGDEVCHVIRYKGIETISYSDIEDGLSEPGGFGKFDSKSEMYLFETVTATTRPNQAYPEGYKTSIVYIPVEDEVKLSIIANYGTWQYVIKHGMTILPADLTEPYKYLTKNWTGGFDKTLTLTISRLVAEQWSNIMLNQAIYNCLTYMSAINAEINEIEPYKGKPRIEPVERSIRYREFRTWDVGSRVGASLRKMHEQKKMYINDKNQAYRLATYHMRPHMRRAHWHRYWTGKKDGSEDRKLTIKWLAPIFVSGNGDDETPVVLHKVD